MAFVLAAYQERTQGCALRANSARRRTACPREPRPSGSDRETGSRLRTHRDHRAVTRRIGHRQGSDRPLHSSSVPAESRAVRRAELRRPARAAARGRALWLRARCVHWRHTSKPGHLEQAAGGTLFLDEVGEMSLPAQAKFLRVLQEREFQRLGGTRVLRTDARTITIAIRRSVQPLEGGDNSDPRRCPRFCQPLPGLAIN
jgi:sigma-54 interacting transcriptional regulator